MKDKNTVGPANTTGETVHFFDKPANVRRVLALLYAVCALLLLADFVLHRHVEHPLEGLPGFYAVFGLVGCVSLVLAAKQLRRWVMRPEDYYDG
jgi:phosphatidylserine synthase